ncbi:PDZ domain-containing protein [Bacillus sp. HMF5848]|uniref:SepM family pheromone-processing serine protease n=1 Tax=Bacillus sp. HMF5848 TaxID=2495421 RepID=UPI000F788D4B|nr:SepM family pheromone-processing serine protease [Bacillus sp. HMF5848]RSK26922.1 PDZ domain-containing protein [Bacillus sp. HMF5848]
MKRIRLYIVALVIGIVIAVAINSYQPPYYITMPGSAEELSPIIEVEGGYDEQGEFMLTTVAFMRANVFNLLWANFNKYHSITPYEAYRQEGESHEEFLDRQLHMMQGAQSASVFVAFTKANKQVQIENTGVYVSHVFEGMPAEGKLNIGDKILAVDNQKVISTDDLISYVKTLSVGKSVKLKVERDQDVVAEDIKIVQYPQNPEQIGVGIGLLQDFIVTSEPDVEIDTSRIGGPSAGLMFSLEIYNQLMEEDITKGYKIAGTGTIDFDGVVGRIGGIDKKIVAANREGAVIFFAPNEEGKIGSNYQIALQTAQDINSDMKIVPIDTFDDAIHYLNSLNEK